MFSLSALLHLCTYLVDSLSLSISPSFKHTKLGYPLNLPSKPKFLFLFQLLILNSTFSLVVSNCWDTGRGVLSILSVLHYALPRFPLVL